MINAVVDYANLSKRMHQLAILEEKSGPEILRDQARLFTRDVIKLTPPTGRSALTESLAEQRRIGQSAVRRDINRHWRAADGVLRYLRQRNPRAAQYFQKYARAGNVQAIKTMAAGLGLQISDAVLSVSESDHDARRGPNGRAFRKKSAPTLVLRSTSVRALLKAKLGKVGTGKGGWVEPASALGVTIPQWIKGHAKSVGVFTQELTGPMKSITIGNLVDYAQKWEGQHRIVQNALKIRHRAMELRIRHLLKEI